MFQKHKQERQVHFSIPSILRKQEDTALCGQIKQTLTLNNIKPAELYKFPLHIDVIKEEIDCKDFYFFILFYYIPGCKHVHLCCKAGNFNVGVCGH